MLCDRVIYRLSDYDEQIYQAVVPSDHFLRRLLRVISWEDFDEVLARYYCPDLGRPAETPLMMLKLEYLRYHYNLSDREVIARATTDLAFRHFLRIPFCGRLPNPSSLCVFRGRLGVEGFRQVFDRLIQSARAQGVVKDRLRIKDASHVLGQVHVPSALILVGQIRDKLLAAAEPFAPLLVEGERVNLEQLRAATKELPPPERLVTRLLHLREMLFWIDQLEQPKDAEKNRLWRTFQQQRELAHKILDDQEHPGSLDRTRSVVDPDVRRGRHGVWYDGYQIDMLVDADSEIITQVNVLPGNGDEALDVLDLVRQEEEAHGNDIQALSMDAAGYQGRLLSELEDPQGLNIDTYVPPIRRGNQGRFTSQEFAEDQTRGVITCPAGQSSVQHQRDNKKQMTIYRFDAAVCRTCPLRTRCLKRPPTKKFGRTVRKTDYRPEYDRALAKIDTEQYAEVRREHPKIERKLCELLIRHGGRRARYRGRWKVLIQELMACLAVNVKRLVRLAYAHDVKFCWP